MVRPLSSPGRRRRPATPSLQQVLSRSVSHEAMLQRVIQAETPPASTIGMAPGVAPGTLPHEEGETRDASAARSATEMEQQAEEEVQLTRPIRVNKSVPSFAPRVAMGTLAGTQTPRSLRSLRASVCPCISDGKAHVRAPRL